MTSSLTSALVAIAAVVVIGLLMRRGSGNSTDAPAPRPDEQDSLASRGSSGIRDDEQQGDATPDGDDHGDAVAVTSDGLAFFPDVHAVRLVPPAEDDDQPWAVASREPDSRNRRGDAAIGMSLHAGDLTGARIVRGGADEGPWRLETLGRDGEYLPWSFETRDGAEAAKDLLESRQIVRLGEDEAGNPVPPSAEGWSEARRLWEQTQADLDMDDPDGDTP